ncbi:MAG TPA: hypothetical protein VEV16_06860 [Daejeonella sp.]|nr:hypothetical protein [Daejeonella sp.]
MRIKKSRIGLFICAYQRNLRENHQITLIVLQILFSALFAGERELIKKYSPQMSPIDADDSADFIPYFIYAYLRNPKQSV